MTMNLDQLNKIYSETKNMACSVSKPWFQYIGGKKKVEGRLNKGIFTILQVGDLLIVHNKDKMSEFKNTRITAIHKASSFAELYKKFADKLLPKEGLKPGEDHNIYEQFYSETDVEKYGVLGIEFELIE